MKGAKILSDMLEMSDSLVRRALEGLTDADLIKRPSDQDNTIGWLMWHKTRVEDIAFADASGEEQFWISDKWHEKFGMEPNPGQMGFRGFARTSDEPRVQERKTFSATPTPFGRARLRCWRASRPRTSTRKSPPRWARPSKSGTTSGRVAADNIQHGGQICYLRGFITGFGWLPF